MKKVLIIIGLLYLAGCSSNSSTTSTTSTNGQQDVNKIGGAMERRGIMSQQDYVRLRQIIDSVRQSRQISDSDLDWSLALLKRPSEPIARARVMSMLASLGKSPQAQKDKIKNAVMPFLSSQNKLERRAAEAVQRSVF